MKLRIDWNKRGRKVYLDTSVVLDNVSEWAVKGELLDVTIILNPEVANCSDIEEARLLIKMKHIDFIAQVSQIIEEPRELEFGIWDKAWDKKHARRK